MTELVELWGHIGNVETKLEMQEMFQRCTHCIRNGLLLLVFTGDKFSGFATVEKKGDIAVIFSLPTSEGADLCLEYITVWGRQVGVKELQLTITSFNGSNYRFVKKSLGFKRKSETFAITI